MTDADTSGEIPEGRVSSLVGNLERNPNPQLSRSFDAQRGICSFSGAEELRRPADERCLRVPPVRVPERNLTPLSALVTPCRNPRRIIDVAE
jgi:hypothetical protein